MFAETQPYAKTTSFAECSLAQPLLSRTEGILELTASGSKPIAAFWKSLGGYHERYNSRGQPGRSGVRYTASLNRLEGGVLGCERRPGIGALFDRRDLRNGRKSRLFNLGCLHEHGLHPVFHIRGNCWFVSEQIGWRVGLWRRCMGPI
jgi:hypothetical protein